MRRKLGLSDGLTVGTCLIGLAVAFSGFAWPNMPRSVPLSGAFVCVASLFVLLAWHTIPDALYRTIISNAPWFFILGGITLTAGGIAWVKHQTAPAVVLQSELLTRAESDFQGFAGGISQREELITLNPVRSPMPTVHEWLRSNLTYMAKILVIYIPFLPDMPGRPYRDTFDTCMILAERYRDILGALGNNGDSMTGPLGNPYERSSKDAVFTGAIYIYYEGNLTEDERAKVRAAFKDRGAMVFFRDRNTLLEERGFNATIGQ